jgi:hypothetical protein
MPAGLALLLAVALGSDVRIDAGVQTEARQRRLLDPPSPALRDALDLTINPRLTAAVTGGLGSATATYDPTFTASDLGPDLHRQHMQQGEARLRLGTRPPWRLDAFASGGIGRSDLITQGRNVGAGAGGGTGGTGASAGPTTISTAATLDLMEWRSGMSLQFAPDRRTQLTLAGEVSEDGGTTPSSQVARPVARAVDGSAELAWRASRLDQLGLRAEATLSRIAALHIDAAFGTALATWRRNLTPQALLTMGGGVSVLQSRVLRNAQLPETGRDTGRIYTPAGMLGISKAAHVPLPPQDQPVPTLTPNPDVDDASARAPHPPVVTPSQAQASDRSRREEVTGQLMASWGGAVDRTTGVATPSAELVGNVRWPIASAVALVGDASGSLYWPRSRARTRRGQVEMGPSFAFGPQATLQLAAYGSWQHTDDHLVPDVTEYGAFLRLTLTARPLTY